MLKSRHTRNICLDSEDIGGGGGGGDFKGRGGFRGGVVAVKADMKDLELVVVEADMEDLELVVVEANVEDSEEVAEEADMEEVVKEEVTEEAPTVTEPPPKRARTEPVAITSSSESDTDSNS